MRLDPLTKTTFGSCSQDPPKSFTLGKARSIAIPLLPNVTVDLDVVQVLLLATPDFGPFSHEFEKFDDSHLLPRGTSPSAIPWQPVIALMQVAAVPPPNNGELQLSGILGLHVANASPNTTRGTSRYHQKINFNRRIGMYVGRGWTYLYAHLVNERQNPSVATALTHILWRKYSHIFQPNE
ncbi:hypothetical protein EAG_07419 [Camponotus floridanus]|uniref:Uncharacterized protein n=1 Tax=Camponotus floridanus TaxID=104421 RepID=E2ASH5_CAMFO|nr:hypothetical protein EAG_07419 [Camponotus floridanus]